VPYTEPFCPQVIDGIGCGDMNLPHQDHNILQGAEGEKLYSEHKKMTRHNPILTQQAHQIGKSTKSPSFSIIPNYSLQCNTHIHCFITKFTIKLGAPFLLNLMPFNIFFHIFLFNHVSLFLIAQLKPKRGFEEEVSPTISVGANFGISRYVMINN